MKAVLEHLGRLEQVGMKSVAEAIKSDERVQITVQGRLALAYENYRYIPQEKIDAFNAKLKELTLKRLGYGHAPGTAPLNKFDVLAIVPLSEFKGAPPAAVLDAVGDALKQGVFDEMEVAKIKSELEYTDPIVFGRIKGCSDRFVIAQWDNDVKVEDLIGPHEG